MSDTNAQKINKKDRQTNKIHRIIVRDIFVVVERPALSVLSCMMLAIDNASVFAFRALHVCKPSKVSRPPASANFSGPLCQPGYQAFGPVQLLEQKVSARVARLYSRLAYPWLECTVYATGRDP